MDKLTPKEYDTATTITTDESYSHLYHFPTPAESNTITNIIQHIPRAISKNQNPSLTTQTEFSIKSRKWSQKETKYFYELLSILGADFGMMEKVQTRRNKKELLNKYKKEQKRNPEGITSLIDNLQYSPVYLRVELIHQYHP